MSVGEEQTECPLCMEPLEMDDINFFPCTCGYQICRFCWHRIRTDENGLCPACRKQYPEDPAEFKPLTEDELQRIKKERRQKDLQRKQKAAENRKHLANVRVVQRNLVFVVGLSQRLADPEVLKKHEYFGKFGKIHKVVINHSTSYAGAQGPSASAYVTYHKPEDALRAIQAVNNIYVDGRTLKASLGTTKYCSHFLRGAQCPKPDCMYLHELGEEAASFTKEEMQQGKHQEYEQKLYEGFMNSQNLSNHQTLPPPTSTNLTVPSTTTTTTTNTNNTSSSKAQRKKNSSPPTIQPGGGPNSGHPPPNTNKEAWPSLGSGGGGGGGVGGTNGGGGRPDRLTNGNKAPHPPSQSPASPASSLTSSSLSSSSTSSSSSSCSSSSCSSSSSSSAHKQDVQNAQNRAPGHHRNNSHQHANNGTELAHNSHSHNNSKTKGSHGTPRNAASPLSSGQSPQPVHHPSLQTSPPLHQVSPPPSQQVAPSPGGHPGVHPPPTQSPIGTSRRSPFDTADSMSLFSNSGFPTSRNPNKPAVAAPTHTTEGISTTEIPDTIPVSSTTDWQAAFGFSSGPASSAAVCEPHDDDLGFDPWDESSKALADLIEKESYSHNSGMPDHSRLSGLMNNDQRIKNLPPGFTPNHIGAYSSQLPRPGASKMMGLQFAPMANVNSQNTYHDMLSDISLSSMGSENHSHHTQNDAFNMKDWQDGLRALLPNINISFGAPTAPVTPPSHPHPAQPHPQQQQQQQQQQPRPHSHKDWSSSSSSSSTSQLQSPSNRDLPLDPAIVISGSIRHSNSLSDDPPHWMASLHHLTEDNTNHRLPFVHQFPFRGPTWAPQAHHPPPGFHQSHLSSPTRVAESHRLAEGLQ